MSRRRDLPGMLASGPKSKDDLSKRLYNQDGSRNLKGEEDRLKAKHPMHSDFSRGDVALKQDKLNDILGRFGVKP